MLVGVVLPRFAGILAELGQDLPPATRALMVTATAVRAAFVPSLVAAAVLAAVWRAWTTSERGRERWHQWLLAIPLVGSVRRAAATARTSWALAALLETGVPLGEALRSAARTAGDAAIERRILRARDQVTAGASLGHAIEDADAMTPTAVRLVRAGEETGRLAALLTHAARIEQERSERIVRSAVRALEPSLILTFACLVALVAAALLQAVYSVRPGV
jgi:general secretion pathway protein F